MPRVSPGTKARLRRILRSGLDRLPRSWFVALRDAHASALHLAPASARRRALAGLVEVARHRSMPVDAFRLSDYPDVQLQGLESAVARELFWYGGDHYEGVETYWWRRCCTIATSVLELGANIGYYTVQGALANPSARYVAVEPHPESVAALEANLALSSVSHVEVVAAAAVGPPGPELVELAIPDRDTFAAPTEAFLVEGGEGVGHHVAQRTVRVRTVEVRTLIEGVDLLKLDIEGHEAPVLESVMDEILRSRPTIFVEVRLAEVDHLRDVIRRLAGEGYSAFAIGTSSLHLVTRGELDSERPLPRYGTRDLILVPGESVSAL